MDVLGLEVQDIDSTAAVTDVTLLIQGLDADGNACYWLRSTVSDKIGRLGAVTVIHTRLVAEVNESFEDD